VTASFDAEDFGKNDAAALIGKYADITWQDDDGRTVTYRSVKVHGCNPGGWLVTSRMILAFWAIREVANVSDLKLPGTTAATTGKE
jgi:hypothetical protein